MPIYVYSCPECDVLVEELRPLGMADWPVVECPVCHGLCEREPTMATLAGASSPLGANRVPIVSEHDTQVERQRDPVRVMHGPGCPCCGAM